VSRVGTLATQPPSQIMVDITCGIYYSILLGCNKGTVASSVPLHQVSTHMPRHIYSTVQRWQVRKAV